MDAARRALGGRTPPAVPGAKNGVPDVSAFLGAVRADGSPDFASMARASGMDPNAFQAHAESLWSKMDALAGDPAAYRAFLEEKARDAGVDAFGGGGGGGGDIRLREAEEANETDAGPGNRQTPGLARADAPRATFLAPAPTFFSRRRNQVDDGDGVRGDEFGVGVVAVWRARESLEELTPVPSAFDTNVGADADGRRKHTREGNTNDAQTPLEVPVRMKRGAAARVEKVALPDPRVAPGDVAAEGHSPLAALASASGAPPPLDATVYDVEAHPDAVARALEDPAYQAALIEAATRLAETQAGAPLFVRDPPGGRRCYARRGEAPPRAAAAAAAADARRRGEGAEGMSASLLTEIAGMGLGEPKSGVSPPARARFPPGGEENGASEKKALIEEVQASRSVRVERDAAGAPTLVSVTLRLPQLTSMRAANLRVGARFITLDPGPGEPTAAVALPVAVDPDAARAKWTKKTRTLAIDAPPAGAVSESMQSEWK